MDNCVNFSTNMEYFFALLSRKWLFITAVFISNCSTLAGQEFSYTQFDGKDGLAGSVVYCSAQDKDGFLWFGTETGLSRYDGTHFHNYSTADGLPDNEIIKLFVDSKNRVWIVPFKNSICYYWRGKIYNESNDSFLRKVNVANEIYNIAEDAEGKILLQEDLAVKILDIQHNKITTIKNIAGQSVGVLQIGPDIHKGFKVLARLNDGTIGIAHVNTGSLSFHPFGKNKDISFLKNSHWISPGIDIIGSFDSLSFFDSVGRFSFSMKLPAGFNDITRVSDSLFALNCIDGSLFLNIKNRQLTRYYIKNAKVNSVLQDDENNLWFTTAGAGIYSLGPGAFQNKQFIVNNIELQVFSIQKIDSQLFVGADNFYLWKIDPNGKATPFPPSFIKHGRRAITSILPLPNKVVLLGTDVGVYVFKKDVWESTVLVGSIKSMATDADTIVCATNGNAFTITSSVKLLDSTLFAGRTSCAYKNHNIYYIGTLNGLYTIDLQRNIKFLGEKVPAFKSRIMAINKTPDGILWIATDGFGVLGYKDGQVKYTITEKDGLTSDICRNIFVSGNEIWVGTVKGLNRIRILHHRVNITKFTRADGLNSDVINAIFVDNNMVYVGTSKGLTYFDVNKISEFSKCNLLVTGINTSSRRWLYDTTGFILPHNQNALQFDYVAISYRSAGDISYKYRLLGIDTNWQTTLQTTLNYPALPSGQYTLQMVATNKYGVKSKMTSISFEIEKLLWEKTWFRVLAILVIAVFVGLFINIRIQSIRKKEREKLAVANRVNELEQHALQAQMNPHFIFNSLNSIQQYVVERNINGANKFISEFARLIRLTLELSSKSEINIEQEILYITTYLELEKTKFEDKFNYQVTVASSINKQEWYLPPMILQPYIENAIRHGIADRKDNKGLITVNFDRKENRLVCIICDNGVGRQRSQQMKQKLGLNLGHQSKGMILTAKRIEMLNSNNSSPILVNIEDVYPGDDDYIGTKVTINFPMLDLDTSN